MNLCDFDEQSGIPVDLEGNVEIYVWLATVFCLGLGSRFPFYTTYVIIT